MGVFFGGPRSPALLSDHGGAVGAGGQPRSPKISWGAQGGWLPCEGMKTIPHGNKTMRRVEAKPQSPLPVHARLPALGYSCQSVKFAPACRPCHAPATLLEKAIGVRGAAVPKLQWTMLKLPSDCRGQQCFVLLFFFLLFFC